MSAEGAGRCHCKATPDNLWLINGVWESAQRLEESKCHCCLQEGEDPGSYRLVSLTLILGKVIEQLMLLPISWHMKDKKVISSSHIDSPRGSQA